MSTQNDLPTVCQTDDGPTDGPTLDDDRTGTDGPNRIGRRPFVKGLGAAAAASVALSLDDGPVGNAQAFPPALIPAAAAVGIIAYGEFIAGPDDEEVDDALSYQNHVREFTRAREDGLMVDETLASLKRDVQLVQNKAREEAIFRIYEAGVDGLSEAEAEAGAEDAIQDAYSTVQRAILQSWNIRAYRWEPQRESSLEQDTPRSQVYEARNLESGEAVDTDNLSSFRISSSNGGGEKGVTLVDGQSITIRKSYNTDPYGYFDPTEPIPNFGSNDMWAMVINAPDPDDYDVDEPKEFDGFETVVNTVSFAEPYHDLLDEYESMMNEVSSMVDTYFQPAQDGEIDLHNLIGPAHLSDTASTAEDYQEAAMALRAMGYPMSDQVCTVSIADLDDLDEDGDPVTHERTGRLSWTAHSGNMLTVGSELNPDNIVGSVFFAYNEPQEDGSTVGQTRELNRPFTVESAEGASGVSFEDRTLVEAETQLTNEEIQQLFQEHYEANEDARENVHDTATGGGGGWSGLSTTDKGIVAVVAAAILGLVTR